MWEPKNCALEAVTSEKFCQVMEGRKGLLLVGEELERRSSIALRGFSGVSVVSEARNTLNCEMPYL